MHKLQDYEYLIALGSSSGARLAMLETATRHIAQEVGTIEKRSRIYATPPWGGVAQNEFLNAVVLVHSISEPQEILAKLLAIEAVMGRLRQTRWSDRCIDLDILMSQSPNQNRGLEFHSSDLNIPHPGMLERDFCLVPAAEIAPDWVHPKTGKTLQEELKAAAFELTASQLNWSD